MTLKLWVNDAKASLYLWKMTVYWATLALVSLEPSEPDQRRFRTKHLSSATYEQEKHEHEATYQAVARRTWLTTRALPARESCTVL